MNLFTIAWRSVKQRGVASLLTTLSMALGVMLVVTVLAIYGVVAESFRNNSSLGYNMIVGAKGGKLQLTLNTVYYLSQPVENIPYDFYLEFLSADERAAEYTAALAPPADAKDKGRYADYVDFAIPVCLGDYFGRFRVVGTKPEMLELVFDLESKETFEFADGRNFHHHSKEHGYFEAVAGSVVAREMGLKVGDMIAPSHGAADGDVHAQKFCLVGILKNTGTPYDRALFVNMEGFYLMDDHAKPMAEEAEMSSDQSPPGGAQTVDDVAIEDDAPVPAATEEHAPHRPLPVEQREVTALLVRTSNPLVAPGLQNTINEGSQAQAVSPVMEIFKLFEIFVSPIQSVLLAITGLVCLVSGVSILVSIYNSMNDRKHEIAVMRALGASRVTVMTIILLESTLLSLGGGVLGWFIGHGMIALASPAIEDRTGVEMGFFAMAPPINVLELLTESPIINISVSPELLLVPALVLLAILVGIWPAMSAYKTDVARSLGS